MSIVRNANSEDLPAVAILLRRYMREALDRDWQASVDDLSRDVRAENLRLVVAVARSSDVAGFASWHRTYDVHHCAVGAEIADMYVLPGFRGKGLAVRMIAHVARESAAYGARFIKGTGAQAAESLYRRFAVLCPGTECYVGGRAFREMAALADLPVRAMVAALPGVSHNFDQ